MPARWRGRPSRDRGCPEAPRSCRRPRPGSASSLPRAGVFSDSRSARDRPSSCAVAQMETLTSSCSRVPRRSARRPVFDCHSSRARSMARPERRSERGAQSWRRSSSMMAPDTRVQAYCSNVAPFSGSNRSTAAIRASRPHDTRSSSSQWAGSSANLPAGEVLDHRCVREHEPVTGGDVAMDAPGPPQRLGAFGGRTGRRSRMLLPLVVNLRTYWDVKRTCKLQHLRFKHIRTPRRWRTYRP